MKIFVERREDKIFLSFDRREGDVEINLNVPKDSEEVLRGFLGIQKLMEDLDKRVSLEILMAECFRLGQVFR